jgi:hypothetical protein
MYPHEPDDLDTARGIINALILSGYLYAILGGLWIIITQN